jgi:outer membrane immunogenic protein
MRIVSKLTGALLAAAIVAPASLFPAVAADLPYRKGQPSPPMAEPAFSWTGFYAGAQGGYAWGNDYTKEYFTATWQYIGLTNYFKPNGAVYGLHAGANYQIGSVVLGAEIDGEGARISGGFTDPPAAPFNPGGYGRTDISAQGSLRARFGFAFDRVLVYATGGLAMAKFQSTYANWGLVTESFDKTVSGYTVGGGVEYALTNNLTIRSEYRYTDYGLIQNHSQIAFPGFSGTQKPRYSTVRAGISYKF